MIEFSEHEKNFLKHYLPLDGEDELIAEKLGLAVGSTRRIYSDILKKLGIDGKRGSNKMRSQAVKVAKFILEHGEKLWTN